MANISETTDRIKTRCETPSQRANRQRAENACLETVEMLRNGSDVSRPQWMALAKGALSMIGGAK